MGEADLKQGGEENEKPSSIFTLKTALKIAAIIGAVGTFIAGTVFGQPLLTDFNLIKDHIVPLRNQDIVGRATSWPVVYQDSFPSGSASSWHFYSGYAGTTASMTTAENNLVIHTQTSVHNQGTLAFVADGAANLPFGNFYMSAQVQDENGCQFGLMFRASLNNRFAWFYVSETGAPYIQVDVLGEKGGLQSVFHQRYRGAVNAIASIGVVQYSNKYIFEINDSAVGSVQSSTVQKHVGKLGLAGSMIGVGTCSCSATATYSFRDLTVRAPAAK